MTIAIVLQVHDGVVLASDSASTINDSTKEATSSIVNVYNNAKKIFNLCKGLPLGSVTYGVGSIGSSSVATLAKDLRRRFAGKDPAFSSWKLNTDAYTIQEVASRAREFLFDECWASAGIEASSASHLGFVIAGYSAGAQLSEVWAIDIVGGKCDPPRLLFGQGVTNVHAGGDPEVFSRLVLGHGFMLRGALAKIGVEAALIPAALKTLQSEMRIQLVEAPMPIQDAIDFAEFLVRTTSEFTRFRRGSPTVGGPVESAAITKHEHFKWVRRKHYYDPTFNRDARNEG